MSNVAAPSAPGRVRFGEFEFDRSSGELRSRGSMIVLQEQPLRLLIALLAEPGHIVTREALYDALWPDGVYVNFDHSLNTAVRRLREALGDRAAAPRFIESVARRGYRFIAPVDVAVTDRGERTALAVLPFLNLSGDVRDAHLVDGFADDLLTELSKIAVFKVISRSSSMQLRDRAKSAKEIADLLRVGIFIEGSVRRVEQRVRVAARVIDARSDSQLWADSYDRDLNEIFAMQKELALRIALAIAPDLPADERAKLGRPATTDVEAYDLYLQGRHCMLSRFTEEGFRDAIELFERAAARDPNYALPHAGMAFAHMCIAGGFGAATPPQTAVVEARNAINRALAIDPFLAEAHGVDACLKFMYEFDYHGAERAFRNAFALGSQRAETLDTYGLLLSALRRYHEALAVQRRAHDLDPLAAVVMSDIATTLLRAGRYDEALEQARAVVRLAPAFPMGHSTLGWAQIKLGDCERGLHSIQRAVGLAPANIMFVAQLGQAYAIAGHDEDARRILDQLLQLSRSRHVFSYHLAYVYAGLREYELAIDCLEEAFRQREGGVYGVAGSFLFTELQQHPRFIELLRRMGLPCEDE